MTHTPGPWENHGAMIIGPNGAIAVDPSSVGMAAADHNSEANARLIAAAPDLLEATADLTAATEAGVTLDSVVGVLREAEEYFDQRADAEYFPNSAAPVGNEEMTRLMEISAILAAFPTEDKDNG